MTGTVSLWTSCVPLIRPTSPATPASRPPPLSPAVAAHSGGGTPLVQHPAPRLPRPCRHKPGHQVSQKVKGQGCRTAPRCLWAPPASRRQGTQPMHAIVRHTHNPLALRRLPFPSPGATFSTTAPPTTPWAWAKAPVAAAPTPPATRCSSRRTTTSTRSSQPSPPPSARRRPAAWWAWLTLCALCPPSPHGPLPWPQGLLCLLARWATRWRRTRRAWLVVLQTMCLARGFGVGRRRPRRRPRLPLAHRLPRGPLPLCGAHPHRLPCADHRLPCADRLLPRRCAVLHPHSSALHRPLRHGNLRAACRRRRRRRCTPLASGCPAVHLTTWAAPAACSIFG